MTRTLTSEIEKVTLSLPRDLVGFADRMARAQGTNRSRVVAEILSDAAARTRDALAAEGYRFYAEESRDFAEASQPAVSEVLS
jgi:metal-responsive CopG/Arc/MetJ family transcriptional regulator